MRDTIESLTDPRGFTLIEVLLAMTLLVIGVSTLASLAAIATRANTAARTTTRASLLATQKMEQLRALTWGYDAAGRPIADTTTDLTAFPPGGGGVGLSVSPAGALVQNTFGYYDFLDASGTPVGDGTDPPAQATFVRRWSVEPLPSNPVNALVLHVRVMRARSTPGGNARAQPDEAAFVSVITRKGT